MNASWVDEVLAFWFEELTEEDWFVRKDSTDEQITARFQSVWESVSAAIPAAAFLDARTALAATIVLDQFPRNMFRGTARAFSSDPLALAVALNALNCDFDRDVAERSRRFLYMPFMHSERIEDQERCIELFGGAQDERAKYAVEHRDIVARFGRFPHRNRALGRTSTVEEQAFLQEHAGFGQ